MKKYVDYDMCKECGGVCCKQNGCIYMPKDFSSMNFDYLKKVLNQGDISISGQPFNGFLGNAWSYMLYLRARNVNSEIVDLIPSGGPCKLLTENGCSLKEPKRPTLGLLVRPTVIGGPCEKKFSSDYPLKWLEYNDVLSQLVKYYTNQDVVDVIATQAAKRIKLIKDKKKLGQELTSTESAIEVWYYTIMANKPYYSINEVKSLKLTRFIND